MTEALKKELNAYFKKVDTLLLCDHKSKIVFLTDLKNDIDEFVQESDADFDSIQATFGTPEEIAESFLKDADIADIKKKMNVKKVFLSCPDFVGLLQKITPDPKGSGVIFYLSGNSRESDR